MPEEKPDPKPEEKNETSQGNGGRWRIGGVVLVVLILIAGFFWLRSRGKEATDDAQVDGHITQIAPRVGGTVAKVHISNNQAVKVGDVLVEIDPRDYQIAVDRAKAELADAVATASGARPACRSRASRRPPA
jgi:membrane fusion protein (multidrug efflux system)